jgi:cysteine desulfurase/selenocysteine lyase
MWENIMTSNNIDTQIPEPSLKGQDIDFKGLSREQLLNPSVLEELAKDFFPEFAGEKVSDPQSITKEGPDSILKTGGIISQDEYYSSIPDILKKEDYAQLSGYYTDISSLYTDKAVLENGTSPIDSKPQKIDEASSSEPESYSSAYKGLTISPVIVPVSEISPSHFDVNAVRKAFPILSEKVNGKDLVWLDNAATTHKPKPVVDRISYFYEHENSNVHRGAHTLAARSTDAYESARGKIAKFLNASSPNEIVFVRGTTEAINLVAQSWGKYNIGKDDEIIISWLEHHANIVPWQMLCAETGAKLRVMPVDERGQLILSEYERLLGPKTKLVAVTHVSNALGTITPVNEIVSSAHKYDAKVLIDGAQSVSHMRVDVQSIDCDWFVFSGHKIFAPTGIGALYGTEEILNSMRPYQGGGNMIADVTFEKTVYQAPPYRFEAGTGNIADAVGLGAAIDYVNSIGIENISRYEHGLLEYGIEALSSIPGLKLIGTAREKASVMSFTLQGFTSEEIGKALSQEGIAVRAGHHCAQPILRRYGLESTVRPSLSFYNTNEEIDLLVSVLKNLKGSRNLG